MATVLAEVSRFVEVAAFSLFAFAEADATGSFLTYLAELAFLDDTAGLPADLLTAADLRLLVRASDLIYRADLIDFADDWAAEAPFLGAVFFEEALLTIFTEISGAFLLSLRVYLVLIGASDFFVIAAGSNSSKVKLIYLRLSFASSSMRRIASFGFDWFSNFMISSIVMRSGF